MLFLHEQLLLIRALLDERDVHVEINFFVCTQDVSCACCFKRVD